MGRRGHDDEMEYDVACWKHGLVTLVWFGLAARCLSRGDGLQFGQCDMMRDNIFWRYGNLADSGEKKGAGLNIQTIRFAHQPDCERKENTLQKPG